MSRVLQCIFVGFLVFALFSKIYAKPLNECLSSPVVPDVIDRAPMRYAQIWFWSNILFRNCGIVMNPRYVKRKPKLSWKYEPDLYYTVIMIDPYGSSMEKAKPREYQYLHWMVVNMQGVDTRRGETRAEYVGPSPPSTGEMHPYVFLVFEHNSVHKFDIPFMAINDTRRANFNVRNFILRYQLDQPILANSFQAKYTSF